MKSEDMVFIMLDHRDGFVNKKQVPENNDNHSNEFSSGLGCKLCEQLTVCGFVLIHLSWISK